MNSDFYNQYKDDIMAFFKAFIELIKTLFEKFGGEDAEADTEATE